MECKKNPQIISELAQHPDITNAVKNVGTKDIKNALNGMQSYMMKNKKEKLLEKNKKALVINTNRKIKTIDVPIGDAEFDEYIKLFLGTDIPLTKKILYNDKEFVCWYNPLTKPINKLASKYIGFKVGGKVILVE